MGAAEVRLPVFLVEGSRPSGARPHLKVLLGLRNLSPKHPRVIVVAKEAIALDHGAQVRRRRIAVGRIGW
eukprot:scaffold356273_cov39-Prasinocladus_malaysianus.AAC.1